MHIALSAVYEFRLHTTELAVFDSKMVNSCWKKLQLVGIVEEVLGKTAGGCYIVAEEGRQCLFRLAIGYFLNMDMMRGTILSPF